MSTIEAGSRIGRYVVGEQVATGHEDSAWFEASEAGLDRPVLVLATRLPADADAAEEIRQRARRLATLSDARVLPVYGQGEEDGVLWLATRRVRGRTLAEAGAPAGESARRLGTQLGDQLEALAAAGLAPVTVDAASVVVEDGGAGAWLVPDPSRPVTDDASQAHRSLDVLLREHGAGGRARRRPWPLALAAAAAIAIAVAVAIAVAHRGGGHHTTVARAGVPAAHVVARIPVGGAAWSVTATPGSVWVATQDGSLLRIDPRTNTVVGAPRRLFGKQSYPQVTAGPSGSLWVSGPLRLERVGANGATVLRKPDYGTTGLHWVNGELWATRFDRHGNARIVRLDPKTFAVRQATPAFGIGTFPVYLRSNRSTVWALNYNDGGVSRIDADGTVTTIATGIGGRAPASAFGRFWIPTAPDQTVDAVDPATMTIAGVTRLPAGTDAVAAAAGSIWVLTDSPSRLYRIDPRTYRVLGASVPLPQKASDLVAIHGDLWVDDPQGKALVRIRPASPAPAPVSEPPATDVLANGPITPGRRLRVTGLPVPFSVVVPDGGFIAQGLALGSPEITELHHHASGVGVNVLTQAFRQPGNRIVPVRTPADFLNALRHDPGLRVGPAKRVTLGGLPGLRVHVVVDPKGPVQQNCPGVPCVLIFPVDHGVNLLTKGEDDFTFVKLGRVLVLVDAGYRDGAGPAFTERIRRIVSSIRFERGAQ